MKRFFVGFFFVFCNTLSAQEHTAYFNFYLDNDIFFITDQYYSSGIFFQYGKVQEATKDSLKRYRMWELGQEMYTPSKRYSSDTADYDYPYGGWSYIKHTRQREISQHKQIEYGLQLGVTGDWSLARWMQNTYHRNVLDLPENAWVDQVAEALHANLFFGYFHQKQWADVIRFRQYSYTRLGTQRTDLGTRMGVSIGSTDALGLGANTLYARRPGDALYIGIDGSYVFHDYMSSGSLFNADSPFTTDPVHWRLTLEVGLVFQGEDWKFLFLYKSRSRDNIFQPQSTHHLMNITYSRFF